MRGALEAAPGVAKIDIKTNTEQFTVHYDPAKIKPDEMVKKLVAAGEKDAKVIKS